jgi:hypothetical protein
MQEGDSNKIGIIWLWLCLNGSWIYTYRISFYVGDSYSKYFISLYDRSILYSKMMLNITFINTFVFQLQCILVAVSFIYGRSVSLPPWLNIFRFSPSLRLWKIFLLRFWNRNASNYVEQKWKRWLELVL